MCTLVKNISNEPRIYESVRRIYDIQSSSEDSLDHRKRRRSLIKNWRATQTASLFIDRLKNELKRGDDFVPRFRSHRNWCPKFPLKYFCERGEIENSTLVDKNVFKNFIHETPKIYAIGLNEPKMRRSVKDNDEEDNVINIGDTVECFKRCSFLAHSTPKSETPNDTPRESTSWKKRMPTLPSFTTLSIPLISSFPIPTDCMTKSACKKEMIFYDCLDFPETDELEIKPICIPRIKSFVKSRVKIATKRIHSSEYDSEVQWSSSVDDILYCSVSRQSFVEETCEPNRDTRKKEDYVLNERSYFKKHISSEITSNDCMKHERVMVNIVNCKTSEEFLRDSSTDQLVEDLFLEEISIGSSTSKYKEFFSPIDTSRETETVSKTPHVENEILKDIRKRIDEDFENSLLKLEEEFEESSLPCHKKSYDQICSLDSDSFLDLEDDLLTGIEHSKSMPMITSTATKRRPTKPIALVSSTLVEDDIYDQKSPRITLSRDTLKEYRTTESNDSRYPSCSDLSSINSIICQSTYDFPSSRLDGMIVSPERTVPSGSIDHSNFDVHSILSRSFSISDVSMSNEYESATSKNEMSSFGFTKDKRNVIKSPKSEYETISASDYEGSKTNLVKELSRNSYLNQRKSSKNIVESIDSGVMMDYSKNDLRGSGNLVQRNTNVCYIYENQFDLEESHDLPMFDFDSDSSYSDESLDRRVDMAVKKCTEDLILLERRMKVKLKRMENRMDDLTHDFLMYFDWNSEDERIGSISTPSLVSLTDSERS